MALQKIAAIALLTLAGHSIAQSDDWIVIAETVDSTVVYSARKGTFDLSKNKVGEQIATFIGRIEYKKDKSIEVVRWYVRQADCDAGSGKLIALDMDGKFKRENDYVKSAGNMAAGVGDFLCYLYSFEKKQNEGKGV